MKLVQVALVAMAALISISAVGQDSFVQDFVSDGSVYLEGYFDDTNVTIYSASREALEKVQTFTLNAEQKKTLDLPEGKYVLESDRLVRLVEEPMPEPVQSEPVIRASEDRAVQENGPVPPKVYVAPWRGSLPHEVYNGKGARLKAVAVPGTANLTQYKWDLSDGYSTGWQNISNRYVIQVDHVFPDGAAGQPWTGTVTVKDETGFTASARYDIVVRPENLDTKRNIAIDDALWYLHSTQTRSGSGETGTGYWRAQNALNAWYMGATGMVVTAFENSGHLPSGDAANPYTETVQRGLNYIMSTLRRHTFGESDKWFDMSPNGYGLKTNADRTFYAGGIVLLAIAGSREPERVVPDGIGIAEVTGHTYKQIAQDMADYFGGGQYDSGSNRGGWRYSYNQAPDMSAVQWPVLGMHAAEENLEIEVHENVKTRLRDGWLVYDQHSNGGFGYTSAGDNINVTKTAAGLACFWWVDTEQSDSDAQRAINYVNNYWGTYNVGNFYPMYAVMKGARLAVPEIAQFGTHDWYTEYSNWIVGHQSADGRWNDNDGWISPYLGPHMRTAMGVLIMTTAVITQPPIALFTIEPNPADVGVEITFDASASFDPNGRPLTYRWDFGDESTGEGMVVTHSYETRETFTVVLTAENDAIPPQQGIATGTVYVTPPNHPPTSVPGGPYFGWIGPVTKPAVTLDGSGSYDINEPADWIVLYEWELDGVYGDGPDGGYDFNEGDTPITQYVWTEPGDYDVALRVTDREDSGFENAGASTTAWTQVEIALDDTPPANTLEISPDAPDGDNDWYVSQPAITISAVDDESGVKEIRYWWDDDAPQAVAGDTAALFAPEGDHVLHYGGVDNVDNFNEETVQIKTDLTTPTASVNLAGTGPTADWYRSAVDVTLDGNAGPSGVATAEKNVDGGGWVAVGLPHSYNEWGQGEHTAAVRLTTVSGKQAEASAEFRIDSVAPATTAEAAPAVPDGANGWYVSVPEVTLTASDPEPSSGLKAINYRWDAEAWTAGGVPSVTVQPPEGEHTLTYYASDEAGNDEAQQALGAKVDTSTPTTSIDLAGDGAHGQDWYHSAVDATLHADGGTSGIATAEVRVDAGDWAAFTDGTVKQISGDGEHTVETRVVTNSGKEATAQASFKIDTTPPVTVVATDPAAPDGNAGWFVTIPDVTLTASDPGGEAIAEIHYWWEGEDETVAAGASVTFAGNPIEAMLYFYAVNENGSPEAERTAEIKIDEQAPVVEAEVAPPVDGDNGWHLTQPTVTVTALDEGAPAGDAGVELMIVAGQTSGVALIRYRWDDDPEQEEAGHMVSLPAAAGEHTLYFGAVDVAGNESPEGSIVTKYDDSTATVGIELAGTVVDKWYTGTVTVKLTADGGMTGIATAQYRLNGGPWTSFESGDEFGVSAEGSTTVEARVTAVSGRSATAEETFIIDNGAPTTTLATVPAEPDGTDGWFVTQPEIRLTASDAGAGVKEVRYWWNDEEVTVVPGASASFDAPAGVNTLHYFAVDLFDQAEAEKQAEIKYDASTPSVAIELAGAVGGEGWYSGDVVATVIADGDGVAVASTEVKIDAGAWAAYETPVTVTGEGSHTVSARMETARGKTAQASATFVIDENPPTTTLATVPAEPNGREGWFITQPEVRLTASDAGAGVKEVRYWWNDGEVTVVPGASASFDAPAGINTLHYFAVDLFDQAEAEKQAEIKYDASTPSVAIELAGPVGGPGWFTGPVGATVVADGDGVAIASTQIKVDAAPWTTYFGAVMVSGEGSHTVGARIETATGKTAQASETFVIDYSAPTTMLATVPPAPDGLDDWFITQPTVKLAAGESGIGVKELHYRWDEDPETVVEGALASTVAPGGIAVLHYFAVDHYGHTEAEKQAEIKYDDTSPGVAIELAGPGGPEWFTGDVEATVVADGDGVAVISTEIKVDSGGWTGYGGPVAISGEGSHSVTARITTARGNTAVASDTFVIDLNPPTTSLTTVPAAPDGAEGWFVTRPEVRLTASDAGVGVEEIHYWWNEAAPEVVAGSSAVFDAPGGVNTLHYFAVDRYGQAEAEKQAEIKYDDTPVGVEVLLAGPGGPDWFGGSVEASVVATGPVQTVEIRVDGAVLWEPYLNPVMISGEGPHSVMARATIASGKKAQVTRQFGIDTQPPTSALKLTPPEPNGAVWGWYVTVPSIRIMATDVGVGVEEIHYAWDDGAETVVAGETAWPTLAEGEHVLHYWAVDRQGRSEDPQERILRLDGQPPSIGEPTQDPPSPGVDDDVEISVSVTDSMRVQTVSLWYTHGTIWERVAMAPQAGAYVGTIPSTTTPKLVQYTITASDPAGNQAERKGFWYYTGSVDLSVTNMIYSGDLRDGGASKVIATVANTGATSLENPVGVALYIDGDRVASGTIASIPMGGSRPVELTWTRTHGEHEVLARADPRNEIPETDENNNDRTDTVTVGRANLVAENLQLPAAIGAGQTVTFSADVRAENGGTPRRFQVTFALDGSTLVDRWIEGLAGGQTATVSASWLATGGTHSVSVKADSSERVAETSEDDNSLQQSLPVIPTPDFVVVSLAASTAAPLPGDGVGLQAVVRNEGADYASAVELRFSADGAPLAAINLGSMAAGQTRTANTTWTASPGHHILKAVIDPRGLVPELDESNNWQETAVDAPGLTLSPTVVNIWSNRATPITFTIANTGSVALNVTGAGSSAQWLTLSSGLPVALTPGQSAPLVFDAAPVSGGTHNVTVRAVAITPQTQQLTLAAPVSVIAADLTTSYTVSLSAQTAVSLGQQADALLTIVNASNQSGVFDIALAGEAAGWASLPAAQVSLGIGQRAVLPIAVSVPTDPATPAAAELRADVSRAGTGQSRSASVTFTVTPGPIISNLLPDDGATLGSNTVAFQWQTNIASSTSVFYREKTQGDPALQAWTELTGPAGTSHQVVSPELARDQWYEFHVQSFSAWGTSTSATRSVFVTRGVVFVENSYSFTIDRDYDQRGSVQIRNNDSEPHMVLVSVENVPPQIIVGFVGSGSQDQLLALAPGQTATVALVMHAQDVVDPAISFTATLDNFGISGENEHISDSALISVALRSINFNFSVQEIASSPTTLARTFRVSNLGDAITDLEVTAGGGLAGMTLFDPGIQHGYLHAGGTATFTVKPTLYVGFTRLEGTITVRGGTHSVTIPVEFVLPEGSSVYIGVIGGIPQVPTLPIGANVIVQDQSAGLEIIEIGDGVADPCVTQVEVSSQLAAGPAPPQVTQYTDDQGRQCAVLVIVTPRPSGGWLQWTVTLTGICEMAYQLPGINVLVSELLHMADWQYQHNFITQAQHDWFVWTAQNVWPFWELVRPALNPDTGDLGDPSTPGGGTGSTASSSDQGAGDMANDAAASNGNPPPPGPGSDSYGGDGASTGVSTSDWYCTNRPNVGSEVGIPDNANGNKPEDDWLKDFFQGEADRRRKISKVCLFAAAYAMFESHRDPTNPLSIPGAPGPDYTSATRGAIDIARSAGQYQNMANDPPSPLYSILAVPAIPEPYEPIGPITEVYLQWYEVSRSMTTEETLVSAMVQARETREGAWAAGDRPWYLRQGRTLRKLADLLQIQQRATARHLALLAEKMRAHYPGGTLTKAQALAIQQRISDSGFTALELEHLLEIILPEVVDDFKNWFVGIDLSEAPDDFIAALEDAAVGNADMAAQLADHKVYNPDVQNVLKVYLAASFGLPWPAGSYRPHDVDVLVNNNLAARLTDTVPEGTYNWEVDPGFLTYAQRGVAPNRITFHTTHLNGGHYVVSEKIALTLQLSQIAIPIVAASQQEANAATHTIAGISPGAPDIGIYKGDIVPTGSVNDRDPVAVRVRVHNIGTLYAPSTTISLYAGDPASGGVLIGQATTSVEPFAVQNVEILWQPEAAGPVTLHAIASPADGELVTANNATSQGVIVDHVLPGDLNADGTVNILDLIRLRNLIHQDAEEYPQADLNGDGKINILDLMQARSRVGR